MYDDDYSGQVNASNKPDKFPLKSFEISEGQRGEKILTMTASKNYIFFLTESNNIFLVKSDSLETINEAYTLPNPKGKTNLKRTLIKYG